MLVITVFLSLLFCANSIPINNGIVGEPEFACGSKSLILSLNTVAPWEGTFYAQNHYSEDGCKISGTGERQNAKLELEFATCGIKRERSLEPRGLYISVTVVMSFHNHFLTKVDRGFTVRCFYMEADKTVSQDLEVSMLTTALQTINVPMPVCEYQILDGGPEGEPVQFTIVGQQVYHKWTCITDAEDTFCMTVYDCFVDDGTGDKIQLLSDDGCSVDKYLLGNLEYPSDLMAGRDAHVFKYADRVNLYFNCQIRITIKDAGQECPKPQCSERRKRSTTVNKDEGAVLDISPPNRLMVADLEMTEDQIPHSLLHPRNRFFHKDRHLESRNISNNQEYCLSHMQFGFIIMLIGICVISTVILGIVYLMRRNKAVEPDMS